MLYQLYTVYRVAVKGKVCEGNKYRKRRRETVRKEMKR
jgi:hypothetical protein